MKARVIKPKSLEKQKKHYLELFNELIWCKGKSGQTSGNGQAFESVNNGLSKTGLGLGLALFSGTVAQQYMTR